MTKKRPAVKRIKAKPRRRSRSETLPATIVSNSTEAPLRQEIADLEAEILRLRGVIDEMGTPKAPKAIGEEIITEHHLAARLKDLEAKLK